MIAGKDTGNGFANSLTERISPVMSCATMPDANDTDSDNDGLTDAVVGVEDCDKDGTPNYVDPRNDGPPGWVRQSGKGPVQCAVLILNHLVKCRWVTSPCQLRGERLCSRSRVAELL